MHTFLANNRDELIARCTGNRERLLAALGNILQNAFKFTRPSTGVTLRADKTGLGLGLSIARQSVEADGGTLSVKNVPGSECVFTISLPLHTLQH